MSVCITCKTETRKYKCTKCFQPYCSLDCYKSHKELDCKPLECIGTSSDIQEPTLHEPFTTEDTVPRDKLDLLKQSAHLKNLLHNPHLRNFLTEIDVATNAWKAIQVAMHEPLFIEFADECLKLIEPEAEDHHLQ